MFRSATRTGLALALLLVGTARAETCRFAGTTSHDGRLAVTTEATEAGGLLTLDVRLDFTIHTWMTDYRYLGQEITTWRSPSDLRSIAVNQRYLADGAVTRQQWDVFTRNGDRLDGFRVQAKRLAEFRRSHPGFLAHWSPDAFGQPWLADYRRATPERRPDLDLPASTAGTPLAAAFYWSRFLAPAAQDLTVSLPSFKRDKIATLSLASSVPGDGWSSRATRLRHPALNASQATSWVSPDHYLLQLALDVQTTWASGQATIKALGCQGIQIR